MALEKDNINGVDGVTDENENPLDEEQSAHNKAAYILTLRRTAKEVKRHKVIVRIISILIVILVALVAIGYAASYFYDKYGTFTVKVNK